MLLRKILSMTNLQFLVLKHDTLMRYLLDKLHTYEHHYSDVLCPLPQDRWDSLLGKHALVAPASTEEVWMSHASLASKAKTVKDKIGSVKSTVNQIAMAINMSTSQTIHRPIGNLSQLLGITLRNLSVVLQISHSQ